MSNQLNSEIAKRLIEESNSRLMVHVQARDEMERKVTNALHGKVPNDIGVICVEAVRKAYEYPIDSEKRLSGVLRSVYVIKE